MEKSHLDAHLEGLTRAGLDPDRVTLDDLALLALYRQGRDGGKDPEAIALVRLGPQRDGVQVIRNGRLSLYRSLPAGKEGEAALGEAIGLDRLNHPEGAVEEVRLTGPGALKAGRAEGP